MELDPLKIIPAEENTPVKFESRTTLLRSGHIIKNGFKSTCVTIYHEWGKKESLLRVD